MKKTITLSAAPGGTSDPKSQKIVAPGQSPNLKSQISDLKSLGQQLAEQYQRAIGGIREVLIFGGMMLQVREVVSTCGNNSTRGPQTKGDGLKGWLTENAPTVNLSTAYRFMDLAEGLRNEFALAKKCDLVHLLTAPVEELPAAQQKARTKIEAFVEGKSQRQLMFEFGHDTKAIDRGGDRNSGKKLKRRTKAEKEFDDAAAKSADWYRFGFLGLRDAHLKPADTWLHLDETSLANFADVLKRLSAEVTEVCQTRKIQPAKLANWQEAITKAIGSGPSIHNS